MPDIVIIVDFSNFFLRWGGGDNVHTFYQPSFTNVDPEDQKNQTM